MSGSHARWRTAINVNAQLMMACLFGAIAWFMWPGTPEWWGLGFLCILMGMGAIAATINALQAALGLYRKEKALAEFQAQGAAPKTARLATVDDLEKAGMLK